MKILPLFFIVVEIHIAQFRFFLLLPFYVNFFASKFSKKVQRTQNEIKNYGLQIPCSFVKMSCLGQTHKIFFVSLYLLRNLVN